MGMLRTLQGQKTVSKIVSGQTVESGHHRQNRMSTSRGQQNQSFRSHQVHQRSPIMNPIPSSHSITPLHQNEDTNLNALDGILVGFVCLAVLQFELSFAIARQALEP